MKGNDKLIAVLNAHLTDELSLSNQYVVQSEMCASWGYGKLYMAIRQQALDEMHHAEWLIERILFFKGDPMVSTLNPMKIGKSVSEMIHHNDHTELKAVHEYNDSIKLARELNDQGTVDLLSKILKMEEGHVVWAETQRAQIKQFGLENYLNNQA